MRTRVILALAVAAGVVCDDGSDEPTAGEAIEQPEPEVGPSAEPPAGPLVPTIAAPAWSGAPAVHAFPEEAQQADSDEAHNLWVVTRNALYVLRPGAGAWLRFTKADGLRDWPILSVAGGAANQAFVGYRGVFGPDPLTDPEAVQRSGDVDRVQLNADGTLAIHHFDLHNSNDARYDESRIIKRLLYVHAGPRAGELYVGTSHGATRVIGDDYADHQHPYTKVPNADGVLSNRFGDMNCLALTPEGDLLLGNNYKLAKIRATAELDDWWDPWKNDWVWAKHAWPGEKTEPIACQSASVGPDGTAYFASRLVGLAVLPAGADPATSNTPFLFPAVPNNEMYAVAADVDGTVWLGSRFGLHRWDPATGTIMHYDESHGVPAGTVAQITVDTLVAPRTLIIVAGGQVVVVSGD